MSFCKPVGKIDSVKTEWIPYPLKELYGDYTLEEFVLKIRNGSLDPFAFIEHSEAERAMLSFMLEDVREYLIAEGYIRPEMIDLGTPEVYFVKKYMIETDILENYISCDELNDDYKETFVPYYYSNEVYENYKFEYKRIEAVKELLSKYLSEKECNTVNLDIESMGKASCNKELLKKAKEKLADAYQELVPLLEQEFAKVYETP